MRVFLYMVLVGAISAVIYDLFRIFRKSFKHKNIFVYIEDFFYWVIVLLLVFYTLLKVNYLELRIFEFIGFALGMILYFSSISRIFVPIMVKLLDFIKKCINFFVKILSFPIHIVLKLLIRPARLVKKLLVKPFNRFKGVFEKFKGGKADEVTSEEE